MHKLQFVLSFLLFAFTLQGLEHSSQEIVDRDNFVKVLNTMRRAVARQIRIPNMHEVVYDDTLFQKSGLIYDEGLQSIQMENYRIGAANLEEFMNPSPNPTNISEEKRQWALRALAIQSYQKRIRCLKYDDQFRCVVGPVIDNRLEGTPGSMCDDGYQNNDGLCSLTPTTTSAPTTKSAIRNHNDDYDEEWVCTSSILFKDFQTLLIFVFWLFLLV